MRERERETEEERVGNKRESDNLESKTYRKRTSNLLLVSAKTSRFTKLEKLVGIVCVN